MFRIGTGTAYRGPFSLGNPLPCCYEKTVEYKEVFVTEGFASYCGSGIIILDPKSLIRIYTSWIRIRIKDERIFNPKPIFSKLSEILGLANANVEKMHHDNELSSLRIRPKVLDFQHYLMPLDII